MSAVLFKLGQKGITFTDDFFDAIRVMKNYKKQDYRRAAAFNSMLNDFFENPNAKSAYVLRALEKKLIDEDIISTSLRSTMSKGKQKAGVSRTDKLSELASANYSFAAKDAQKEAAKIKATSEKRMSQLRDPRFIAKANKGRTMAAYRKALPFWMDVSKQLDGTTSILEAIQKTAGYSSPIKSHSRIKGTLSGVGGKRAGGWPAQKDLMMKSDDPGVREAAQKIQNEIDFYERHKRAYSYVEPDEATYIRPKGKLQELNVEGFNNRPSAADVKNILSNPKFKGFIQPYNKLIGEHIMEGRTRNKMERLVTDFAKKHGGFKEASYITTNRRNRMKTPLTSQILTNSIKKSELLNSVIPGQKPSAKILEQIKLHDAAIAKASNQLSDLGLETAVFDSAANKGKGKIKYFGKQYNNMSELVQSVNTGQIPGSTGKGGAGGPRFLPMKEITIDGKKVLTNKYQDGGFAGKFSNFLDATKKQFFEGGEYPYDVASNEPLEGDIANLIPTAEAVQMMTAPLTLQPVDELVDQTLDSIDYDLATDDKIQSYLKSLDFYNEEENRFKQGLNFFTNRKNMFRGADNYFPESVLEEYLPEGSFVKQEPTTDFNEMGQPVNELGQTEQDYINDYLQYTNSDDYKLRTNILFNPDLAKERAAIQSKLYGNQLKKAGLLTANALIETYQAVAPTAYAGDAIEDLAEIKEGDHYLQRIIDLHTKKDEKTGQLLLPYVNPLTGEQIDENTTLYDLFKPGMPENQLDVTTGEVEFPDGFSVEEINDKIAFSKQLRVPGQIGFKDLKKSAGKFAMGVVPAFLGSGIRARLIETINRGDIGALSKFLKVAPQLMGFPTRQDMAAFFKFTLKTIPKEMITKNENLIALTQFVENISTSKFMEGKDTYYRNIRNELENPQYKEQRDILTKRLVEIYTNPDMTENVIDPNNYNKILEEGKMFEDMPSFVYDMAQQEANKIIFKEHYRLIGKKPPEQKTMQDDTLFEELTGIDLAPGERENPPQINPRTKEPYDNVRGMAMGGDPGQFTDPLRTPDDSAVDVRGIQEDSPYLSIDELDLFEEANLKPTLDNQMPEVQLASANIFGKLPGWAVYLDKKGDLLSSGKQTQNLIKIGDKVSEATKSPTENINRFYSNLEAKLLDPSVPDTFTTPEELFNFFQSRNIGKLEVEDYQLPQLFQSIFQSGQPVTKAQLLSRIKEAPIRKLKSQTFGFRSEIDNGDGQFIDYKYGDGHFEPGANPGTYRESVIYLKPDDIPGDPAAYKHSVHNFFPANDAYVVGWSRLTDRPAIIPGTSKQLSGDTTTKLLELEKKRDRLTAITNKSAQDIVDQSGGRVSIEQAQKNIDNAQKQLTKVQNDIENFGSGAKQATVGDETVNVTFADEIQSDIFQRYRKHLEQTKDEYQKLVSKIGETKASDPRFIRDELYSSDVNALTVAYYAKHKDILRPVFRTEQDFVGHIKALQESNAVMKEFAQIRPGMLTEGAMEPVREAQKQRDNVLKFFDEIRVDPDTLKQLFPNVPFKDRKAWGDVLVKNDLHMAAKRLFVDGDQNAPTWYAITPAKLVANRYGQNGTTATPLAQRSGKKGVGTYEFYGGPDATDVNGKHYTSILEQSLKRAANINNAEFKIIKVGISTPNKQNKVIQIVDLSDGQVNVVKTINVEKGKTREAMAEANMFINSQPNPTRLSTNTTSTPSGFETVDAYAIKLTPEMVLPSKTHMAIGGYVKYDPMPSIEEVIGVA